MLTTRPVKASRAGMVLIFLARKLQTMFPRAWDSRHVLTNPSPLASSALTRARLSPASR